jgi:hypothetical protein
MCPIDELLPCPENVRLYRPIDPDDPDVCVLADSIREHGIREPLVVTEDGYILSGHRRHVAAQIAGLEEAPGRTEPVRYGGGDRDQIIRLLREYNRQRVKSLDEMLREEVVATDPHIAYRRLLNHREQKSDMSDYCAPAIKLTERRTRSRIGRLKRPMLDAAVGVVHQMRRYWPLSVRQIHYLLLNAPPLRNANRPQSRYANDLNSYKDLCDLLTRARLDGRISWRAIADETRPVSTWAAYVNPQDFIREQLDDLFQDYARNLQQSQPNHVEIVAEKLTVKNIITRVAARYCLPMTIGRGYSSIPPRHAMAQRFLSSGKAKLVILVLSDFDPDGEGIAESFGRSMRDDFGIEGVVAIKAALTHDQVGELGLQPEMEAKRGSSQ